MAAAGEKAGVLAKVLTCAVVGLEGELVQVEVDIGRQGISNFIVVGLPDTAVQEARERVRAAVRNSGLVFPPRRITVNLAPAELRKSVGAVVAAILEELRAATSEQALRERYCERDGGWARGVAARQGLGQEHQADLRHIEDAAFGPRWLELTHGRRFDLRRSLVP